MLGFLDRRRGMGAEVGFQGGKVRVPHTHRPLDRHCFEPFHSILKIELEVVPQGVLGDAHQLGDLAMR